MRNLLIVLGFLMGCAEGAELVGAEVVSEPVESAATGSYEEPCLRIFTPDAESFPYVEQAVDVWSVATGCDISIGDHGFPVQTIDYIYKNGVDESGGLAGGVARHDPDGNYYVIEISRFTIVPDVVVIHELGHVLSENKNHAETGVMHPMASIPTINEESLSVICSGLPCLQFNPEN